MLPSKLKRHLTTNYNYLSEKPRKFFIRKLSEMKKQSVVFSNFLSILAKTQLASFKVAHRIAKCKKPHTIAEELILPATNDLVSTMIGESGAQDLKTVPLLNNTICKRTEKIADNINDQLVTNMRGNEFSLQLHEATISTNNKDVNLICYLRFINKNGDIVEDLLFCKPILLSCKAHHLFAILKNFSRKIILIGNIVLVYAVMLPVLYPVALTSYEL